MKHRGSGPAKPKQPSPRASEKTWRSYLKRLRAWNSLKRAIRSASSVVTKKKHGKRR